MTWIITAFSIIGTVMNIKKMKACFWVWAATNLAWAIVDFRAGMYSQSALFAVYFCLAVWGILAWRRG